MMMNRKAPSTPETAKPSTGAPVTGSNKFWRWSMTMVPVMWAVWAALVLVLAAIFLYRSQLERDEEDQIFLDDSFNHVKTQQEAILLKVNNLKPVLRVSMTLASLATVFVIGYYVVDVVNQFK
jgi:hypothetical protein